MKFNFTRQGLRGRAKTLERCFEVLPGATSWTILVGMFLISFWKPVAAAALIIAFDLYWLFRIFYLTLFLVLAYLRLSIEKKTDWMKRIGDLDSRSKFPEKRSAHLSVRYGTYETASRETDKGSSWKEKVSLWFHQRTLKELERSSEVPPASNGIYHLVIFSIFKETRRIIEPGVQGLLSQKFPAERFLVILAVEARAPLAVLQEAEAVQKEYRQHFLDFLVVVHPDGLPGEARVKGANITYAAREASDFFTSHGIPFEKVVVSSFDADTVVDRDYFSCLTYHFLACPSRQRASFQPIPVYHNNIWEAPGFSRVLDIGSSFFQLIEATHPDRLVTFSSHSMSFKALVEIGFWPVDMISDDSAIFWKAYIHYDGDYRVVPLYVTLSMDVVNAGSWWKTIVNVYQQKRRWAWGVENFPLVMRAFLEADSIPLASRISHAFKLFENHISWATWGFLLTVIGWFPAIFASREFSSSVLYYSAPRITNTIFGLASLALIATIFLSLSLLPKKRVKYHWLKRVGLAFEWLLVPFIVTFLSALPALDAQTHLMTGRYMEFWTTEKQRKGP